VRVGHRLDGGGEGLRVGDVAHRRSADPPAAFTSSQTCASLSALRAIATTWSPSAASRRTIAAPIPREPPVTSATLFSFITNSQLRPVARGRAASAGSRPMVPPGVLRHTNRPGPRR
jgi:hypothetical protein